MTLSVKQSRANEISSKLAYEIESGRLSPGSSLDERALAERFSVSRTPVREAIAQLAALNLVTVAPRQGVVVTRMTIPQLREMLELLGEFEALCARYAARRMDAKEREALQESVRACFAAAEAGDTRQYIRENVKFHGLLHIGARNRYLADQVHSIHRQIRRYRANDFQTRQQMEKSAADHQRIAAAILRADENGAQEAMAIHVPAGNIGFAEFLSRLPASFLEDETVSLSSEFYAGS
jgi:DNA-binding GntR family transcriptional regulator